MGDGADEAREAEERHPDWEPEDVGGAVDQGEAERAERWPKIQPGQILDEGDMIALAKADEALLVPPGVERGPTPWERLGIWIRTMDEGAVAVRKDEIGEWYVAMEFGREAEDSPMVGGAAYGHGTTLEAALNEALKDVRA